MNRRALLTGASTAFLAGCSGLASTDEQDTPEQFALSIATIVNKHAASSHQAEVVVVIDEERVHEETVELAPENDPESSVEITCEFPGEADTIEVRAALPNGTEGTANTNRDEDLRAGTKHLRAEMRIRNSGDIDAWFHPVQEEDVPDCERTPTDS